MKKLDQFISDMETVAKLFRHQVYAIFVAGFVVWAILL